MEPLHVRATFDQAPPDRLIELVLHARMATSAPTYREQVGEMVASFAAIASMSLDVLIEDAENKEGWRSLLERLDALMLLIEGATGEIVHGNVRTIVPDLMAELEAKERAALARIRRLFEQVEDAMDNATCDAALAALAAGKEKLVPFEEVLAELGLQ